MASENDKVAPAHTEPRSPLWFKIALVILFIVSVAAIFLVASRTGQSTQIVMMQFSPVIGLVIVLLVGLMRLTDSRKNRRRDPGDR